ncbi:tetratricopeptide repeat protein 36 [Thamnocephalis sphaerospora]|uniref:Tetratricopeptide repeat protein 36 n=1 Tax=Thamnocephalis sphaerospora TaxID=78915 RepID=A0A4V1IX79_9FUNG|nr:tetratricopeptide repeat protein 36 [Thamnocephalis sphaerospora]|eukprot:RKP10119.1 tetratricopeptide repeat protein 36 [Thamnocephalis sphaerospora]
MSSQANTQPSAASSATISPHDQRVLDLVLNADGELSLAALTQKPTADTPSEAQPPAIPEELLAKLKALEKEGVQCAEANNLAGAIEKFSKAVELCPTYASAYNNRAQARRLQGDLDGAFLDLGHAIEYAVGDAAILKQAYTQRGIIQKARGNADAAFQDFERGARYGNPVAKEAAVRENPYAKMCNAIMVEAMNKLHK